MLLPYVAAIVVAVFVTLYALAPLFSSTSPSTQAESFNLIPSTVPDAFLILPLDSLFELSVFQTKSIQFQCFPNFSPQYP